ncbi:hypothetical protein PYCC9005_005678 [Savitreella phatthalungensis]
MARLRWLTLPLALLVLIALSLYRTKTIRRGVRSNADDFEQQTLAAVKIPTDKEQIWQNGSLAVDKTLLFNAWIGGPVPSYFERFLDGVRASEMHLLLVSTYDSPELCPTGHDQPRSHSVYDKIEVICVDMETLVSDAASALCNHWGCGDGSLRGVHRALSEYLALDGQALNSFKPVYRTIFAKQFAEMGRRYPSVGFSHWLRIDLDVILGDAPSLLPAHLLEYDAFTFSPGPSMDYTQVYLRGYLTGFRMSPEVDTAWLGMRTFANAKTFRRHYHGRGFDVRRRMGLASDEGDLSVTILSDARYSWIVEPGLLVVDLDLETDPVGLIAYSSQNIAVRYGAARPSNSAPIIMPTDASLELTSKCYMPWLAPVDRVCLRRNGSLDRYSRSGDAIRVMRARGGLICAERISHQSDVRRLAYHFQDSKHALRYGLESSCIVQRTRSKTWRKDCARS